MRSALSRSAAPRGAAGLWGGCSSGAYRGGGTLPPGNQLATVGAAHDDLAAQTRIHRRVLGRQWPAIAANNAVHWSTPAYGGTAAVTALALAVLLRQQFYETAAAHARVQGCESTKYCRQYCTILKTLYYKKKAL